MNITAVARKARVSTATVSRTINDSPSVSPKTAERVRRAIEQLGFYPDVNARALGSGRSSLYGLIISDITNPFFPELVKAFEDVAVTHNKEILIANTNYDRARMERCVTRMLQRKVDGVAIMTSEMDERLQEVFSRRKIPLVFLDIRAAGVGVSSVRIDYRAGMLQAFEHLIELGHKDIAFLTGPLTLASAQVRFETFQQALQQHGMSHDHRRTAEGNHRVEGGYKAMLQVLDSGAKTTAVLCSNDLTAIGAMEAIYEKGLRIPDDISLVGYDDIQLSAYTHPGLTTVSVPRTELANTAFLSLLQMGDKTALRTSGEEHIFTPKLVRRRSTAAPKQ